MAIIADLLLGRAEMKRLISTVITTVLLISGCCSCGNQCVEDGTQRGLITSREAPRGEVGIAVAGVVRSTPAIRSSDSTFKSQARSSDAPIGPDSGAFSDSDRLTQLEKDVGGLRTVTLGLSKAVDALNKKCQ